MEGAELAVIGASGDVAREIVAQALREQVLTPAGRLQLVGRADGHSAGKLLGVMSDLNDAYAEVAPTLEVVLEPERITADVVVMAAGATGSPTNSLPYPFGARAVAPRLRRSRSLRDDAERMVGITAVMRDVAERFEVWLIGSRRCVGAQR